MRRAAIVGVAVGAAALLVVGGGIVWALNRPPSLEDAAGSYLRALSEGDDAAIQALLDGTRPPDVGDTTAEAFAGASEYISEPKIDAITRSGSSKATGTATARLDGATRTIAFAFALVDGRWRLSEDELPVLTAMTTLGDTVRIGDAVVAASTRVPLLPATYPVTAEPAGLLRGDASVVVTNQDTLTTRVEATLAPEATVQAQTEIEDYARSCTATAESVPARCGLRVPWAADLAELDRIAFRIDRLPVLEFSDDARTFAATSGVVVATATGTTRAGTTASFTYRADDWALRGTVDFDGALMVLTVE